LNKYHAKKTVYDNITFDSQKEGARYLELKMLEKAGKISHLTVQPKYKLASPHCTVAYPNGRVAIYTPDFSYLSYDDNTLIVEDVKGGKGTMTEASKLRMAVFSALYGIQVTIT